jgi:hypothetical protein
VARQAVNVVGALFQLGMTAAASTTIQGVAAEGPRSLVEPALYAFTIWALICGAGRTPRRKRTPGRATRLGLEVYGLWCEKPLLFPPESGGPIRDHRRARARREARARRRREADSIASSPRGPISEEKRQSSSCKTLEAPYSERKGQR